MNSVVSRLIAVENTRAFPNQFDVTLSGSSEMASIDQFSFLAKRITLGSYALDVDRIGSIQRTFIRKATLPDTITLTVKETNDWKTLRFFYNWYTTAYFDPNRNLFISGNVEKKKKNLTIYAFTGEYYPGGDLIDAASKRPEDSGQAYDMLIEAKDALLVGNITLPTFNYDESTPVEHNFTLQSDNIRITWQGARNRSSLQEAQTSKESSRGWISKPIRTGNQEEA